MKRIQVMYNQTMYHLPVPTGIIIYKQRIITNEKMFMGDNPFYL